MWKRRSGERGDSRTRTGLLGWIVGIAGVGAVALTVATAPSNEGHTERSSKATGVAVTAAGVGSKPAETAPQPATTAVTSTVPPPTPPPPRAGHTECQDWLGRRFLTSVYSVKVDHPLARTVAEAADIGYTHVGPWYEDDRWAAATSAAQTGLCTIFPVGPNRSIDQLLDDPATARSTVLADLEQALASPALDASISAWALLPEEPKTERADHLQLLAELSDLVQATDPLSRPLYTYLPSNADVAEITLAAGHLDVLGQGNYLTTDGEHDERVRLLASIRRTQQAADDAGRNGWSIPVVEHRIHDGRMDPTLTDRVEAWVRHDLHTAMAAGADGFLAFSGFPQSDHRSDFELYRQAHRTVMNEMRDAGLFVLHDTAPPAPVDLVVIDGPAALEILADVPPPLNETLQTLPSTTVRAWSSGDDEVVLVVNHANDPITATVTTDSSTTTITLGPLAITIITH